MIIHIPGLVLVGLYALRLISLTSIPCVFVTYGFTLHFLTVDFKGVFLGFVAFGWLVSAFAGFVLPCLLWLAALTCPLCSPSMAGFDAIPWHYESLFEWREK